MYHRCVLGPASFFHPFISQLPVSDTFMSWNSEEQMWLQEPCVIFSSSLIYRLFLKVSSNLFSSRFITSKAQRRSSSLRAVYDRVFVNHLQSMFPVAWLIIHTYIHTYMHAYIRTHIHTYIYIYGRTLLHTLFIFSSTATMRFRPCCRYSYKNQGPQLLLSANLPDLIFF